MTQPTEDAQRDLEQRALRNVRGLLDKIEHEEHSGRRTTVKIAVACGVVALVLVVILVAWVGRRGEPAPTSVVIPAPAKLAK